MKAIKILEREIKKIDDKIESLENERNQIINAIDNLNGNSTPIIPKQKLIIHLFDENKKNDGNLYYHLNNNPNVSKDIPLLLKDKNFSSIEIMYDGDAKQNLILDKFKEVYKIGDSNGI